MLDSSNKQSENDPGESLGTYLCWVRVTTGECEVQVLNCYLEPGEQVYQKERVKRVTDIIKDILR